LGGVQAGSIVGVNKRRRSREAEKREKGKEGEGQVEAVVVVNRAPKNGARASPKPFALFTRA
jgi:hypothetical protein